MSAEIKEFLKRIEMFIGLSEPMLDKVAALCHERTYAANSVIIERSSDADNFYLIKDGIVQIITAPEEEAEIRSDAVVVTLGKGQSFGEMALIDSGKRSATVKAGSEVNLLAIDCREFTGLCEKDTSLGYLVVKNIAVDLSFKLRYRNLI